MKPPVIPTVVVAAAAAVMIALGIWQIDRAREKEALLAQFRHAAGLSAISFPTAPQSKPLPLFRRATAICLESKSKRTTAGRNRAGEVGYVQIVQCRTAAEGPGMAVEIGWSRDPNLDVKWTGGPVSGIIAPDSRNRMRLVADIPAPGLQPSAAPSIESIPNNHRFYAVQWFLFAAMAVVIYLLALRGRLKAAARTSQQIDPPAP